MKALDTTRLSKGQLELLKYVLDSIDNRISPSMIGARMRLSNIEHKPGQKPIGQIVYTSADYSGVWTRA